MKVCWPAPERNKQPIVAVLKRVLPERGTLLELASGSGQHIAHFASELPNIRFIASDIDPDNLASIRAYRAEGGDNFLPPREIDVRSHEWQVGPVDAIFNANMIHIAPWASCVALIDGVRRNLARGGVFVLYGPFRVDGLHTAASNAEFDLSLRERNPEWGVRDLEAVVELAEAAGLSFRERVTMPANNLCLVFERRRESLVP